MKPELLLPAKGPEELRTAIIFGADAVYIGGQTLGLRAGSRNFTAEEMSDAVKFAHTNGKKVYVTANIFAHNEDLDSAEAYFEVLDRIRPDAVLISDPGLFMLFQEKCPEIPIHISTQANNTNYGAFNFWYRQGAKRVVCARELTLKEIARIREKIPASMEIEAFVHGSMCVSYSGRCLLSSYFTGRSANKGACAHPCRWNYVVMEETRPGEYLPIEEDERGTYVFNSADLNMIGHIPELIEAGVNSFKVEGRMKNSLYVASVARAYRMAIDDYMESDQKYREKLPKYIEETGKCTVRRFSTGFFFGKPGAEAQIYDESTYKSEYVYLGYVASVSEDGSACIHQKNKFSVGEQVEAMNPSGQDSLLLIEEIRNEEGEIVESAPHAGEVAKVRFRNLADPDKPYVPHEFDILRRQTHEP